MLTIGEFSRLGRISARMLRHYDRLGLLRPAYVGDENNYRYYDAAQLSVLSQIETFKEYGFSLAEIAALLGLSREEQARHIHMRRLRAHEEMAGLRRTLRRMEQDIAKMEGIDMSSELYHVITMESPAQRMFGLRRRISIGQTHDLFEELYAELKRRGLRRTGATQLIYHGKEFSYEDMDVEAQAEVSGEGEGVQLLPAGLCAAVTHTGPYETLKYAYDALAGWMARHPEYRVCGPAVERYLKDEGMAASPEELETAVLFPITKSDAP